jgi:predicted CXXCH cytochrome family protein
MKHKSVLHGPLRDGHCTDCHDPHGSAYPKLLLADSRGALCQRCHKQQSDPASTLVHSEATSSSCAACHEPHSAEQPRLLKQEAYALCTSCHKQTRSAPGEALSVHAPARENCMTCHDPHASKYKHGLKQSAPQLCLSCHRNIKDSLAGNAVVHGALTQEQSCLACHVSHFSKLAKLQKSPQPQQCLACHDRTLLSSNGRMISNMAALLKENPDHHGPIRLGACTACHQPHAGDQSKLLSAPYPPEFYAPFRVEQYQLCFTCHTPDLVLVPQASAPTGFKNGEKNLHWLHVKQEKGRTCRACHEVHASRQAFHIRESVPFGPSGWSYTLKYRKTENGGTCEAGCHGEKSYDHGERPRTLSVVALSQKGQALLPAADTSPPPATAPVAGVRSGDFAVPAPPFTPGAFPCTACHDPMVAVNTQRRVLGKPHEDIQLRHDEQHRWCLDCHNTQNRDVLRSASGEPIPFAESYRLCGQCHGGQYRDWKTGVHGKRTGQWDGRKEYLLCVHCHNPHSPKFNQIKPLPPPLRPKSN